MMQERMFCLIILCFALVASRPPIKFEYDNVEQDQEEPSVAFAIPGLEELEYGRYIQEVVNELEQDSNFRMLIESDNYTRAEDIASQLALLSHSIRTRLDELKRREVERLITLQRALDSLKGVGKRVKADESWLRVAMRHIDIRNPDSFSEADLIRMIRQTATDLERLDDYRREQFKRYEMRKAFERLRSYKLQNATRSGSAAASVDLKPKEILPKAPPVAHSNDKRVNYPGWRAHLTDVWKNMDGQDGDFNARTFFALHDTNTDGHLDLNEVNALMRMELEKLYPSAGAATSQPGAVITDINERYEEMNRLREALFKQVDSNSDALISEDEFLLWTRSSDFDRSDETWYALADMPPTFTSEEFQEFVREEEQNILINNEPVALNANPDGDVALNVNPNENLDVYAENFAILLPDPVDENQKPNAIGASKVVSDRAEQIIDMNHLVDLMVL